MFIRRYKWYILVVLVLVGAFAYFQNGNGDYKTVEVKRITLENTVQFSGTVEPADTIELSFENAGTVENIYVGEGDSVSGGEVLVALDDTKARASLAQALADLTQEEVYLSELKRGTRPEEITVQEVKVANLKTAIDDARRNLVTLLQKAYTTSDDAVRNSVDQFFEDPRSSNPELTPRASFSADQILRTEVEQGRFTMETLLEEWDADVQALVVDEDLTSHVSFTYGRLSSVKSFLSQVALVLNKAVPSSNATQTQINTWKTNIATARAAVDTLITEISTSEGTYNTSLSNLSLAEEELALMRAGATTEQINRQEAIVDLKEALVVSAREAVNDLTITAPFSGVIASRNIDSGEVVVPGQIVLSVISDNALEIKGDVSELDIIELEVGAIADVLLDAYGGREVFRAEIVHIDPVETLINTVPTYGVTLVFTEGSTERVRSGMTANMFVTTEKKEDVLAIPVDVLRERNFTQASVSILNAMGEPEEREITIGIQGVSGNVEVTSGLVEGELVIRE